MKSVLFQLCIFVCSLNLKSTSTLRTRNNAKYRSCSCKCIESNLYSHVNPCPPSLARNWSVHINMLRSFVGHFVSQPAVYCIIAIQSDKHLHIKLTEWNCLSDKTAESSSVMLCTRRKFECHAHVAHIYLERSMILECIQHPHRHRVLSIIICFPFISFVNNHISQLLFGKMSENNFPTASLWRRRQRINRSYSYAMPIKIIIRGWNCQASNLVERTSHGR